ncbi:MAG: sulfatase, partial [Melioribacteraceae bacterium]|nr:sulfatase [Melioribacteraceae bacterium]
MGCRKLLILFISLTLISCGIDEKPPNILVLVADDAGYRDFGCYGNDVIKTPNIDLLAREGLKFNNAFLTISQCSPSRISILSGLYPHATGAEDLHMPLPENVKLLPSYLKRKNYYSGLLRKSHLGPNGDKQFNYVSSSLNDFHVFLDSASSNPFFLWVGFVDPHRPYEKNIIEYPQNADEVVVPPYFIDNKETREDLADYYNEIMRMDLRIGEYIDELKNRNLFNNTLIIFLSDNGAPFPREKGTVYDAGIKTPLIFTWTDKISKSVEYENLTSVIDLAPTILGIAGIEVPDHMQGRSIKKVMSDQSTPGREYIFAERNWHNCDEHIRSVRNNNYKLISNSYIDLPFGTPSDISRSPTWKSLYELKLNEELTEAQGHLFEVPRSRYEFYDLE